MEIIKTAKDIDNKKIVYDGCMVSYSGIIVNLMNPSIDEIVLEDIAHGLAFTCRWGGATKSYYSVAEHCCMMHDKVEDSLKATALFHDCEEAYWGDFIKPIKNLLPTEMREQMRVLRSMIFTKYGIREITKEIEDVDFKMLQWDFDNLILENRHKGWDCYKAEKEWLKRARLYVSSYIPMNGNVKKRIV